MLYLHPEVWRAFPLFILDTFRMTGGMVPFCVLCSCLSKSASTSKNLVFYLKPKTVQRRIRVADGYPLAFRSTVGSTANDWPSTERIKNTNNEN